MTIYLNLDSINSIKKEATKNVKYRLETIEDFIWGDLEGMSPREKIADLENAVMYGGVSGCITSLIGYHEAVAFTLLYLDEIEDLLDSHGLTIHDFSEKSRTVKCLLNDLAWWAYETVAHNILERLKEEQEALEEEKEDTLTEKQGEMEEELGASVWDFNYKYHEGLTVQMVAALNDFIGAQHEPEKAAEFNSVVSDLGLYVEVYENYLNGYGFQKHDFVICDKNDSPLYRKTAFITSKRDFGGFAHHFENKDALTEEQRQTVERLADWFDSRFEKVIEEAYNSLEDFFEDRICEFWDIINY